MTVPSEPTKSSGSRTTGGQSPTGNGLASTEPKAAPGEAPPVDEALILAFVRRQLPEEQARKVEVLIKTYREWDVVHTRLMLEDYRQNPHD